jgi:hypothetical protein
VFEPGNVKAATRNFRAPAKKQWNRQGIDELLENIAAHIEKRWPTHEYRLVEVGPAAFNFVWDHEKLPPSSASPSSTIAMSSAIASPENNP